MNLLSSSIQFLFRPVRAMAFFGYISIFLGLTATVRAAITQNDPVATGLNSEAQTNATTYQPAANGLKAAPLTGTASASTNLSQIGTTNSPFALDDKHKLAIGDRLSFRILEDEYDPKEDPKPFFVTDSGDLEVPYIGRVAAENKTCRQLAAEIKTALEKEYYYGIIP